MIWWGYKGNSEGDQGVLVLYCAVVVALLSYCVKVIKMQHMWIETMFCISLMMVFVHSHGWSTSSQSVWNRLSRVWSKPVRKLQHSEIKLPYKITSEKIHSSYRGGRTRG